MLVHTVDVKTGSPTEQCVQHQKMQSCRTCLHGTASIKSGARQWQREFKFTGTHAMDVSTHKEAGNSSR